jgi:hypothetical protein
MESNCCYVENGATLECCEWAFENDQLVHADIVFITEPYILKYLEIREDYQVVGTKFDT